MEWKDILSVLSVLLTFVGYAPYFYFILARKTKPHIFTWAIGGIVNSIAFFAQSAGKGGAGIWTAGVTALLCYAIVILSLRFGEKNITRSDCVAFVCALLAIGLWYFTKDPLGAVCLATLTDILGVYPTWRKSHHKPYEESVFGWAVCGVRSALSAFAMEHYSLVTLVYPATLAVVNGGTAIYLACRRRAKGA